MLRSPDLQGYVQKGPFINGTVITASELTANLTATGRTFTTQISDNKGTFVFKNIQLNTSYLQLMADGFYFDEVRGENSGAQLTLFALADISNLNEINVNVLSHLEKDRVLFLMENREMDLKDAKKQAQREVLEIFGIRKEFMTNSELLDISREGEDNAILLAVSAILQGNGSVAELSELLANVALDIREDGILDNEVLRERIHSNMIKLNTSQIRENLEQRYNELNVGAIIPSFERYIENDVAPDELVFETQMDVAVETAVFSNLATVGGLPEGVTVDASADNGELFVNGEQVHNNTQVSNGDKLQLKVLSSPAYADTTVATLTVGSSVSSFQVITFTDPWRQKANYPGNAYEGLVGFSIREILYVGTGYIDNNSFEKEFYQYNPNADTWKRIADFPGEARAFATGFSLDGKGYVGLGASDKEFSSFNTHYRDFWEYDPTADAWQEVTDFPGEERRGASAFTINNLAYVGYGQSYANQYNNFWRYNPSSDSWSSVASVGEEGRALAISFATDEKGYAGISFNSVSYFTDFWEYDPSKDRWTKKQSLDEGSMGTPGFGRVVGFLLYGKGYTNYSNSGSELYSFDPTTGQWDDTGYYTPLSSGKSVLGLSNSTHGYVLSGSKTARVSLWEFTPPKK